MVLQQGVDEFRAAAQIVLGKDAAHTGLDGALPDGQHLHDLAVFPSAEEPPKDFALAAVRRSERFHPAYDRRALFFAHAVTRGKVSAVLEPAEIRKGAILPSANPS